MKARVIAAILAYCVATSAEKLVYLARPGAILHAQDSLIADPSLPDNIVSENEKNAKLYRVDLKGFPFGGHHSNKPDRLIADPSLPVSDIHAENSKNAKLYRVDLKGYPFGGHHSNRPDSLEKKVKSQLKAAATRYSTTNNTLLLDAGSSNLFEFTGTIGIGTPPQYFKSYFDSSTSVTLVVKGTESYSKYGSEKSDGYVASQSSSFKNTGEEFTLFNVTDKSSQTFTTYEDTICVGDGSDYISAVGPFAKIDKKDWQDGEEILAHF
ncbi:hypothetical protein HK096_009780, partial [Nowakowskiella sp. JEL0078]